MPGRRGCNVKKSNLHFKAFYAAGENSLFSPPPCRSASCMKGQNCFTRQRFLYEKIHVSKERLHLSWGNHGDGTDKLDADYTFIWEEGYAANN